jgi:hypothetical protein
VNLTTATPAEIDTVLAEIWERREDARFAGIMAAHALREAEAKVEKYSQEGAATWNLSTWERQVTDLTAKIEAAQVAFRAAVAEAAPYEAEFTRRGGWTRAYKVLNSNGHIHTSMDCHTCFNTTRFGWLPQVSGLDESEIVDMAGEGACTVCYPTAPAIGPNTLYTPVEAAERAARAAEKAAKAEAKAAKSLSLDGSVVEVRWTYTWMDKDRRGWKDIKTYRAAELFVVEALSRPGVVDSDVPTPEVLDQVLGMMAAKKGMSVEEIVKPLQAKADKKRKARVW